MRAAPLAMGTLEIVLKASWKLKCIGIGAQVQRCFVCICVSASLDPIMDEHRCIYAGNRIYWSDRMIFVYIHEKIRR